MKALNYLLSIKDSIPKGHTYDAELDEAIAELKELPHLTFDVVREIYKDNKAQLKAKGKKIEELKSHKYTRVEVISFDGRVFCGICKNGSYYEASTQDNGKTLKLFLKKTA